VDCNCNSNHNHAKSHCQAPGNDDNGRFCPEVKGRNPKIGMVGGLFFGKRGWGVFSFLERCSAWRSCCIRFRPVVFSALKLKGSSMIKPDLWSQRRIFKKSSPVTGRVAEVVWG